MSTNPVSASVKDAGDLFATVGPRASVRDFAALFEALGSRQSENDGSKEVCVDLGCSKCEDVAAHPTTAQKPTPGRNDPREDPEGEVASTPGSPIPVFLSTLAPTAIEETKPQSGEQELTANVQIIREKLELLNVEPLTDSLAMRSEVGIAESKVDSKSKGNGKVGSVGGIQNSASVSNDSEKILSAISPDIPLSAVGAEKTETEALPPKCGTGLQRREAKARSRISASTSPDGVLADEFRTDEKATPEPGSTRAKLSARTSDFTVGVHESSKGSYEAVTTEKGRGASKRSVAAQPVVATTVVTGIEVLAGGGTLVENKSDLQKIVQAPLEQSAKNAGADDGNGEQAAQVREREPRSEAPVAGISPGLEHWTKSTEVQRGILNLDGKAEMSVHLRSQGSGSLEIRTVVQDHKVEASIISSEGFAMNASTEAIGALRDRLATHALTLETLSFQNSPMESGASPEGRRQNETPREVGTEKRSNTDDLVEKSSVPGLQGHSGLLNVRV